MLHHQCQPGEPPDTDQELVRGHSNVAGEAIEQQVGPPEKDHARDDDVLGLGVWVEGDAEVDDVDAAHEEEEEVLAEEHVAETGVDAAVDGADELVLAGEPLEAELDVGAKRGHHLLMGPGLGGPAGASGKLEPVLAVGGLAASGALGPAETGRRRRPT